MRGGSPSKPALPGVRTSSSSLKFLFLSRRSAITWRLAEGYGKRFTIIVVAEGVHLPPELRRLSRGGSVAMLVGDAISFCAHKEVRVSVLGHIQRGGSPSPCDRVLGTRFVAKVTELIANHDFGKMVCLHGESVQAVDIAEAVGHLKLVDPDGELVTTARAMGYLLWRLRALTNRRHQEPAITAC